MVHIFYGDSAADSFACFNKTSKAIVLREALLDGPAALPSESWLSLRAQHLAEAFDGNYEECLDDLQSFEQALARLDREEEVVCWFGRDLFCQIGLIYLLVRLSETPPASLSLACPTGAEDGPYCFGDVAPAEMNDLLVNRRPLDRLNLQHAAIAWHLYADADPRALNGVFDGSIELGPSFAATLELHASRFPWVGDNLGITDRAILMALRDGPLPFSELFREVSKRLRNVTWGDLQVRNICWRLAESEPSLLAVSGSGARDELALANVTLTPAGQAALQGRCVPIARPEHWIGGCRLQGEAPWRWDSAARRIVYSGT